MTREEKAAVADYLIRETAANKRPEGADHKAILAEVAVIHDMSIQTLRNHVLNATMMGAV